MSRLVHRRVRMPVARFPGMQRLQRSIMIDLERRPGPRKTKTEQYYYFALSKGRSLNTTHVYLYTCRVVDYIPQQPD